MYPPTARLSSLYGFHSTSLKNQWKQHAMYELRASIRYNQSVEDGYKRVDNNAGKGSDSMLYEALLAKDPDDGQNLLMYAVRWGREDWFLHLVQHIKEQVQYALQRHTPI